MPFPLSELEPTANVFGKRQGLKRGEKEHDIGRNAPEVPSPHIRGFRLEDHVLLEVRNVEAVIQGAR